MRPTSKRQNQARKYRTTPSRRLAQRPQAHWDVARRDTEQQHGPQQSDDPVKYFGSENWPLRRWRRPQAAASQLKTRTPKEVQRELWRHCVLFVRRIHWAVCAPRPNPATPSAKRCFASTVGPHQMRKPGGAVRCAPMSKAICSCSRRRMRFATWMPARPLHRRERESTIVRQTDVLDRNRSSAAMNFVHPLFCTHCERQAKLASVRANSVFRPPIDSAQPSASRYPPLQAWRAC